MAEKGRVSEAVVRRLPGYYRYLEELEKEGLQRISSQELSVRMGLTASQIRQDINCFGALGQQGYGYNIQELRGHIGNILGLSHAYHAIVVGAGNIGRAVACYGGFARLGFSIKALFDQDEALVGEKVGEAHVRPVSSLDAYCKENQVEVAIIAIPAKQAQAMADQLVALGVRGLWNFAPVELQVPKGCAVKNVHMTDSLLVLSYHMNNA